MLSAYSCIFQNLFENQISKHAVLFLALYARHSMKRIQTNIFLNEVLRKIFGSTGERARWQGKITY